MLMSVQFLQNPLLDALYPDKWYNNQNFTEQELGYILHENRLLGAARLRQVCMHRSIAKSNLSVYNNNNNNNKQR